MLKYDVLRCYLKVTQKMDCSKQALGGVPVMWKLVCLIIAVFSVALTPPFFSSFFFLV